MAEFGDIPEYLQYTEEPNLQAFYYIHQIKLFSIGSENHELLSPELTHDLTFPGGRELDLEAAVDHPVLLGAWDSPVTTPRFYTWLTSIEAAPFFANTRRVMQEVFGLVSGTKIKPQTKRETNPFSFGCEFMRAGHVSLRVLGNCACLGTNPDGHIVDHHDWDTGWAEYELHNIDMPVQRISLLAGLGHLATMCEGGATPKI